MSAQEINTCSFCRAERPVLRQYLHAKNKPTVGDGSDFIYYCDECGIKERVIDPSPMTTLNTIIEEEKHHRNVDLLNRYIREAYPQGEAIVGLVDDILTTAMQRAYEAGEKKAYRRGYEQGRFDSEMDVLRDIPPPDHFEPDQDKK